MDMEDLLGLNAPAVEYGIANIPYVKPSRYYLGTSASRSYRRCKRKWGFQSSMRLGLQRDTEENINFWFGSAIHFAMEDYFGYNRFGDPRRAFKAYYEAFNVAERPEGAAEHYELGLGMLEYFMQWYPKHNAELQFKTAWFRRTPIANTNDFAYELVPEHTAQAIPGVEFEMCLDMDIRIIVSATTGRILGVLKPGTFWIDQVFDEFKQFDCLYSSVDTVFGCKVDLEDFDRIYEVTSIDNLTSVQVRIQPICFHGTCDRILVDKYNRLWILDYKTAKSADTDKLDTDDQISRYCWALEQVIGKPIYGFIYLQMTKAVPRAPRILNSGELSTDKRQKTTHGLYRQAIIKMYGEVEKAPAKVIETLNVLAEKETPEGDDFIRWDLVTRSTEQKISTYHHIMAEALEMVNTEQYLIPSPTRDCIWDCPFREACLALDKQDMSAFTAALLDFNPRDKERSDAPAEFYKRIKWPENVPVGGPTDAELQISQVEFNVILPNKNEEE